MAKELPYFRFTVQEWQNGDIALEDYSLQGLFINICGFYWIKDCSLSKSHLMKKFKGSEVMIESLIELGILKMDSENENVRIEFLDEQYSSLSDLSEKRRKSGSKGGKTYSKWGNIERVQGEQFYVLLFYNQDEMFIKCGVTQTSISQRYSVPVPYTIITLFQVLDKKSTEIEIKVNDLLSKYRFIPSNKFGGYTECSNVNGLNEIIPYLKQIGCNPLVNIDQTLTKLQANFNQTTTYKDKDKEKDNNNRAFAADANKDLKGYRLYLHECVRDKQASRDTLFMQCKIDLARRNEIWEDFINNSITNIPLIEDDKHAWNSFKKFIIDNQKNYNKNGKANFTGF